MPTEIHSQVRGFIIARGELEQLPATPRAPAERHIRLCARLVTEEAFELLEALGMNVAVEKAHMLARVDSSAFAPEAVDLPAAIDATLDIDYCTEHLRQWFGVDGQEPAREVHRTNMAKFRNGVIKDPVTGKTKKPEGWTPPDIARCLREQGWRSDEARVAEVHFRASIVDAAERVAEVFATRDGVEMRRVEWSLSLEALREIHPFVPANRPILRMPSLADVRSLLGPNGETKLFLSIFDSPC